MGHGSLLNCIHYDLPQTNVNEYQHFWEGTFDGLMSCPGGSVQLESKLLVNMEVRFQHCPDKPSWLPKAECMGDYRKFWISSLGFYYNIA